MGDGNWFGSEEKRKIGGENVLLAMRKIAQFFPIRKRICVGHSDSVFGGIN